MSVPEQLDWDVVRNRAAQIPEAAFQFVREGLGHTVKSIQAQGADTMATDTPRHVTGQQLCFGLRDLAIERYGKLAGTVFRRWGVRRTDDFGVMVYALIDRGEMKRSDGDSIDDFHAVYDFEESFAGPDSLEPAHS
ncbi:MAG: hypothetical protein JNM07_02390 [Phycisphaerae bacterium]|nr:hypothetical protein [Phycisphaerae bacterium]